MTTTNTVHLTTMINATPTRTLSTTPFFFSTCPPPTRSTQAHTLFPYTTLFRSRALGHHLEQRDGERLGHELEPDRLRSEEHTSELQSRELISYAVFCWKKKRSGGRIPVWVVACGVCGGGRGRGRC